MIHRYAITKKDKRFIDKAAYVVGILMPLSTLPQVIQVFTSRDVTGLSMLTWVMYLVLTSLFLIYALVDKIKPLIFTQATWVIIDAMMIAGILVYS